jgi:glycosyltransferase involved in cell wall biosynthesis
LARALRSVFAQSRVPDEVIVVDDGSTDGTADMVRRDFGSVRLLTQEHGGVSAARNRGIREANGEWIAFLDSDDEWAPNKLDRQLAELDAQPQFKLCHTDEIWIRRGQRVNPKVKHAKAGGFIFNNCLPLCAMSPSAVLMHRSLFDEVGFFDEQLPVCEDYDMWLRVCSRHPVLFVEDPLVIKYGGHDDQLSSAYWGMDRFRIAALENILAVPDLKKEYRQAATGMLIEKIDIYVHGVRKRGRLAEVEELERKKHRYTALVADPAVLKEKV